MSSKNDFKDAIIETIVAFGTGTIFSLLAIKFRELVGEVTEEPGTQP